MLRELKKNTHVRKRGSFKYERADLPKETKFTVGEFPEVTGILAEEYVLRKNSLTADCQNEREREEMTI